MSLIRPIIAIYPIKCNIIEILKINIWKKLFNDDDKFKENLTGWLDKISSYLCLFYAKIYIHINERRGIFYKEIQLI